MRVSPVPQLTTVLRADDSHAALVFIIQTFYLSSAYHLIK